MLEYLRPRWQRFLAFKYPRYYSFSRAADDGVWQYYYLDGAGTLHRNFPRPRDHDDQFIDVSYDHWRGALSMLLTGKARKCALLPSTPIKLDTSLVWKIEHETHYLFYLLDGSLRILTAEQQQRADRSGKPAPLLTYRLPRSIIKARIVIDSWEMVTGYFLTEDGQVWKDSIKERVTDAFELVVLRSSGKAHALTPRGPEQLT